MFAEPQKRDDMGRSGAREDVSLEDIVTVFRSVMIGHFRSLIPGTNINESTLLASDYLNHFHGLVMLLEAVATDPKGFADDLMGWRPLTYEEHFSASGFRDKTLAIAAYRRAPPQISARFDEAVAKLHGEAVTVIAEVATELKGRNKRRLHQACEEGWRGCASSLSRPTGSPRENRRRIASIPLPISAPRARSTVVQHALTGQYTGQYDGTAELIGLAAWRLGPGRAPSFRRQDALLKAP